MCRLCNFPGRGHFLHQFVRTELQNWWQAPYLQGVYSVAIRVEGVHQMHDGWKNDWLDIR